MTINRCMGKEVVVHVHNGMLLSHEKEKCESAVLRWMNLEPVIGSKVSQKEKNRSYINAYIRNLETRY